VVEGKIIGAIGVSGPRTAQPTLRPLKPAAPTL
jgi:hypothetical protein